MRLRDWFWNRGRVRELEFRRQELEFEIESLQSLLSNYRAARDRVYGDGIEAGLIRVMEDHRGPYQLPVLGVSNVRAGTTMTMRGQQVAASAIVYTPDLMPSCAIPMMAKALANHFSADAFESLLTGWRKETNT